MTTAKGNKPLPVPPAICAWCKKSISTEKCSYGYRSKVRKRALANQPCFCPGKKCVIAYCSWKRAVEHGEIPRRLKHGL